MKQGPTEEIRSRYKGLIPQSGAYSGPPTDISSYLPENLRPYVHTPTFWGRPAVVLAAWFVWVVGAIVAIGWVCGVFSK